MKKLLDSKSVAFILSHKAWGLLCLSIIILGLATLFAYQDLPKSFFEQDEWATFENSLYAIQNNTTAYIINLVTPSFTNSHFSPFTRIITFFNFLLARMNFSIYAYESIILHTLNAILVFIFFTLLTKKRSTALLGAIFFTICAASYQAVTWMGTFIGTQGCTFFGLLSLIAFLKYLANKEKKLLYLTLGLFIIALLFKESALFLILLYPVLAYLFGEQGQKFWPFIKSQLIFIVTLAVIFLLKIIPMLTAQTNSLIMGGADSNFLPKVLYNLIFDPLKALSHIFVNARTIYDLAEKLAILKYPGLTTDAYAQQTIISEYIIVLMSIAVILGLIVLYKYVIKNIFNKKLLIFSILFILTSALPYIILDQATSPSSRYYYLTAIGGGLLLALILIELAQFITTRIKIQPLKLVLMILIVLGLALPYYALQIKFLHKSVDYFVSLGSERRGILDQILTTYPYLPDKAVFFFEGDIVPFQTGFGYPLLISYLNKGEKNVALMQPKMFLIKSDAQDYREVGGQGFGYFRDFEKLLKNYETSNLTSKNIFAFHWSSKEHKLTDITEEIRAKIIKTTKKYTIEQATLSDVIEDNIVILGNKQFFPIEINQTQTNYIDDNGRNITIYKDSINYAYGGAYLTVAQKGTGNTNYSFDKNFECYSLDFVKSVNVNDKAEKFQVISTPNNFQIIFDRPITPTETINLSLGLAGKVITYKKNSAEKYFIEASQISVTGTGEKKYTIDVGDKLKALRSTWNPFTTGYEAQAFNASGSKIITDWSGINTDKLIIEFKDNLEKGETVSIPILRLSQLADNDTIIYKYKN